MSTAGREWCLGGKEEEGWKTGRFRLRDGRMGPVQERIRAASEEMGEGWKRTVLFFCFYLVVIDIENYK